MDICGTNWTQNPANACDNHKYIYSGSFLTESPPPSQYIPSVYSSRNVYGELRRMMHEKHPVLQKNGTYALALSKYRILVLSVFKGNVYCHIWNNKNKKHVSLNLDELDSVLTNKRVVQDIMDQLLMSNAEKKYSNFPFEVQKNGTYALVLSGDKKMVLSLFKRKVYCHLWDNKNKKHVSLNRNQLMCVLSNKADIEHITELLSENVEQ